MNRFRYFARKVSQNNTKTAWVLKGDIRKFFASIDHEILKKILEKHIADLDIAWLLAQVINSFHTEGKLDKGLPLGNLTSQLLVNIYMNELDQFIKRELKVRYYIRYADDFVIAHENRAYLVNLIPKISKFLETQLKLSLHPQKVFIKTLSSGIDFLGWVHFPNYRVLRTSTKKRMFRNLLLNQKENSLVSYRGLLSHGNTHKLIQRIEEPLFDN